MSDRTDCLEETLLKRSLLVKGVLPGAWYIREGLEGILRILRD